MERKWDCKSVYSFISNILSSMMWFILHTIFIEIEAIVKSRPKTTKMISDTQSLLPLLPTNILTMKSKVIKLPPRTFSAADIYSRKRWKRSSISLINFGLDCKMVFCKLFKNCKLGVLFYRGSIENLHWKEQLANR